MHMWESGTVNMQVLCGSFYVLIVNFHLFIPASYMYINDA